MKCFKCGKDNANDASFCNGCGMSMAAQKPTPVSVSDTPLRDMWNSFSPKAKRWIIGIGVVLLLWVMVNLSKTSKPINNASPTSTNQSAASAPSQPVKHEESLPASTHLANAKKALADGYNPKGKDKSWGRVKDARQSLIAIRSTDKEYAEAQKLLVEVDRREAEIEKWAQGAARQIYAEQLEENYLKKGMDITVTLSGTDNTTIKLKYVLFSRPLVYQLTNDADFMANIRKSGFKKIIFTDGYSNTWTQDL